MPMIGVTHTADGAPKISRAVTGKVSIGMAPELAGTKHPVRLDHFIFLKKAAGKQGEMAWAIDKEKTDHYGQNCTDIPIILMDDDPDKVFPAEFAAYTKTEKWCHGDGEKAKRKQPDGTWKEWKPCANHGCPDFEAEPARCKPSGRLYFMLAEFPSLGTVYKLDTSSYQSCREMYTALQDLRTVTGGRLMGLKVNLTVRPEKNVYTQGDRRHTGTKHILGLELSANNMKQLMTNLVETQTAFQGVQRQLAGRVIEVEDEDDAAQIASEFVYPTDQVQPADKPAAEPEIPSRAVTLFRLLDYNRAKRDHAIGTARGDYSVLIPALEKELAAKIEQGTAKTGESREEFHADRMGQTGADNAEKRNQQQPPKPKIGGVKF